jgi:hypothetical protein
MRKGYIHFPGQVLLHKGVGRVDRLLAVHVGPLGQGLQDAAWPTCDAYYFRFLVAPPPTTHIKCVADKQKYLKDHNKNNSKCHLYRMLFNAYNCTQVGWPRSERLNFWPFHVCGENKNQD